MFSTGRFGGQRGTRYKNPRRPSAVEVLVVEWKLGVNAAHKTLFPRAVTVETLIAVYTPAGWPRPFYAGVVARNGRVIEAAPILKRP